MIDDTDRGYTLGDGLFETVLVVDGQPRWLELHLARLRAGCDVIGLPQPEHIAVPKLPESGRHALRVNWSAGMGGRGLDRPAPVAARMTVTLAPAPALGPARLATALGVRRNGFSPASRLKTLSYIDNVLAREEARAAGASEALVLNTLGQVACAAAANLFWIRDGRIFTPSLACGVLAGIVRGRLMQAHRVEEVVAEPEALAAADAVFLTNSLTGVRAVQWLDGRALAPHPMVAAMAASL
jgi:branched-subunit amino acid aminotransferase/4-amino-4-deoxychorismate lyase